MAMPAPASMQLNVASPGMTQHDLLDGMNPLHALLPSAYILMTLV